MWPLGHMQALCPLHTGCLRLRSVWEGKCEAAARLVQARWHCAAARMEKERGMDTLQTMRRLVQSEWQQLKLMRRRYLQVGFSVS